MSGVGLFALAGIVIRNGILLIEFIDELRERGMEVDEAVVEGGSIRMTPVILTASAAILGLIPLAIGVNIDFARMFSELNPHFYLGGDNVKFWGPSCMDHDLWIIHRYLPNLIGCAHHVYARSQSACAVEENCSLGQVFVELRRYGCLKNHESYFGNIVETQNFTSLRWVNYYPISLILLHLNPQLIQLLLINRCRRIHHQVAAAGSFRVSNNIADCFAA
jgi:hypothetical protein